MRTAQGFEETNLAAQRQRLMSGKCSVDEMVAILKKEYDLSYVNYQNKFSDSALENLLMICNDIYSYSQTGEVLITDRDYDLYMEEWIKRGHERLIYPDNLSLKKTWDIVTHAEPGLVGTIDKVYDANAFMRWATNDQVSEAEIEENPEIYNCYHDAYIIAPKFDGISAVLTIHHDEIIQALTRRDGYAGQDITKLITSIPKYANTAEDLVQAILGSCFDMYGYNIQKMIKGVDFEHIHLKCELLMSQNSYLGLKEEMIDSGLKPYANRRSAVSAIVNTPTNIKYAKYLTVMPLMLLSKYKDRDKIFILYGPEDSFIYDAKDGSSVNSLYKHCVSILNDLRDPDENFPYRVDGIVCYPLTKIGEYQYEPFSDNELDFMDGSMAFKINLNEADTRIIKGYVSVGLLGKAIPMLKVKTVEVNETNVEDVSLGSWDNYTNMRLHEGELVTIYSAGDVIPQAKVKEPRDYPEDAKPLKIKKRCPYCGEELERKKAEYWCENESCSHRIVGRITNFLSKIGAVDIGEGKIENLFNHGILSDIKDLFDGTTLDLLQKEKYEGWDTISIENFKNELNRLMGTPIEVSTFYGALGIRGMAKKKCRFIFKKIEEDDLFDRDRFDLITLLCTVDGISEVGAEVFSDFIKENKKSIKALRKYFTLIQDRKYKGSVCFTGFRNEEYVEIIDDLGYEVTDSVTADTVLVITASTNSKSKKCAAARAKNIPIEHVSRWEQIKDMLKY